ncbi:B-box zinc finger protein 20 [Lotus japonicus]|uniref:B-box zinc finger protein 20 n=1 Tax=Lotus japonicus TaxID=34305 RepID=UPI0025867288|nr:B-box zinc finger protein 20 [Lotus japonicus]
MKIQCDVCDKVEASVFCPADEAALCHSCDRAIHHANKLASKHERFTLHHPSSIDLPLCDICQERRACLFCQEDRAILCRECDLSIHRANQHTQKHNRFLLTGLKLSNTCLDSDSSSTDRITVSSEARNSRSSKASRPRSGSNENACSSLRFEDNMASDTGSASTSSISEYLIETIPGYCFEDFLDASFAPNGFCKNYDYHSGFQAQTQVQSPQLSHSSLLLQNGYCTVPVPSPPFMKKSRSSR